MINLEAEGKPRDECGIVGVYDHPESVRINYLGLYALQHRGQESCGIVSFDGKQNKKAIGMGKVVDFFSRDVLDDIAAKFSIGHVRYSTTGDSALENAQPILVGCSWGQVATAHNGNIVNAKKLRRKLEQEGHIFQNTNDTEVVSHLIARSKADNYVDAVIDSLTQLDGAYSMVIMRGDTMIFMRDPNGFRPLSLGKVNGFWIGASETSAFDVVGAEYERDVLPGEIVVIDKEGMRSIFPFEKRRVSQCIFELIYFARPNSMVFSESVHKFRTLLGRIMAQENSVEGDVVIPVPDSGTIPALGYAKEANIPFDMGLIRSHYIGRTFIEPTQRIRDFGVKIKFSPVKNILEGKRVIVVDDSLVRGTTSTKIVKMLRDAGAKEVHLRIAAPPAKNPCFYGIDFPDENELIANRLTIEEMEKQFGVDSLRYISIEGMYQAMTIVDNEHKFCAACFDGKYPVEPLDHKEGVSCPSSSVVVEK